MKIPAELPIEAVTAIVDTREQQRLNLAPMRCEVDGLTTGDYSVRGLEHIIAIERKSLPDLVACVGVERERFDREIMRLVAYPVRGLVIESTWEEIERGEWRSKVKPNAVIGSLLGWAASGIPLLMVGDHERAGKYVARLLYTAARRRWREARTLIAGTEAAV